MIAFIYIAGGIAVIATIMVITRSNAVHALLYLIVSLLAVAMIFFLLGAPFIAALEIIIYAGAIMVLFLFVVMMLNLGAGSERQERGLLSPAGWVGPAFLATLLLGELIYIITKIGIKDTNITETSPHEVGVTLFGPYVVGVELASLLLLSGLIGAHYLARRRTAGDQEGEDIP